MTVHEDDDGLYTVADVERKYRIPASTQRTWRAIGEALGPLSFRLAGSRIVYWRSAVDAWIAEQERAEKETAS